MVSPANLRCPEREHDAGDEFHGSPFSVGYDSHGRAVVRGLSLERPAWRRAHAGTPHAGRPCAPSALSRAIQSLVGSGVAPAQAVGMAQLTHGRDVHPGHRPVGLSLSRCG